MAEMNLGRNSILVTAFFAVMLTSATLALAGFEMAAPSAVPAPAPAPAASPIVTPQGGISWDAGVPQMPTQKVQGIEAMPLTSAERSNMPPASSSDIVSGFGSDLPLLVALQQVVPQQYKVSLSPGVDAGVHVSWEGDKPWEQALSSMLSPVQLAFVIQGNALVVKQRGSNTPAPSRAVASSRKADTIPADMISWNNNQQSTSPIKMTPQHSAPPPVQETEVASLPAPATSQPVSAPMPMHEPSSVAAPVKIAAAPVPAPAPLHSAAEPTWRAERGQTLRTVLSDWSTAAHVQLYWSTDYDYKLNADIAYTGNFEQAVGKLLEQFSVAKPQPYGQLHRNSGTAGVLVINTYGTYN